MKIKKKRKIIILSAAAAVLVGVFFFGLMNDKVIESVKRETAKILVKEYIPNQNVDIASRMVSSQSDSIYLDFRKKFRFHYQTIGLASFSDSSKMIMISEPPPHFEVDSIRSICAKFTYGISVKQHRIGYDGRVSDVLIALANATDENVNNLVNKLSKQIYLSDYKPNTLKLPSEEKRVYFTQSNIDYQISLYEFNEWFIDNKEEFITLEDTSHSYSVNTFFDKKMRGVYFSKLPGFVAWVIAKKSDLADQLGAIRQFTLDADLILGAFSDSSTLVVIGREREAPLNVLPPLNVESILLLASITEKELSQSLDVNDFLAGKMKNGSDWCPTYLSRELENTEFGHLLTITDVLLKDWSEKGTIKEAFYRYPEPGYYPFDQPLFKKLGLNELVYNWNTANAMYAIDMEGFTIYSLNRTGALPVSYFNSQERSVSIGSRYENQAYYYFATLGNTDLARVVQYTALYQLFIDNQISYSGNVYSAFPKNKPFLLTKPTKNLLTLFKEIKDVQIDYLIDSLVERNFVAYQKKEVLKQLGKNEEKYGFTYPEDRVQAIFLEVKENTKNDLKNDFYNVRSMLKALSEDNFDKVARYLAYPRGSIVHDQASYNIMLKARQVNKLMRSIGKQNLDLINLDLNEVKNYFANNLSNSSAKYLKTPSIIVTYNDLLTTGGHNLSSKISRVNSLTNYKRSSSTPVQTYQKPSSSETPVAQSTPTSKGTHPSSPSTKPATSRPTSSSAKPATSSSAKSSTKPAASSTPKPAIRQRADVISSAPRSQRGF